jgi:RNA polymerase sigma-70 factor (ECF subfamily)
VASPADAEDVLQDVLIRVHRGIDSLDDDQRFGPWVYRIASNAVMDHLRSRARRTRTVGAGDVHDAGRAAENVDDLEADLGDCVALFVARLPSPYREAITLTELEGLTQKQAADMLGVSLSGMKSRVQRGRERIRRMFTECCELTLDARGRVVECTPRSLAEVPADCQGAARAWARSHR